MSGEWKTRKFGAHLQRGGTGLFEMRCLLEAFAEHGDFETLKRQTVEENILGKTSEHMLKAMLSAFRRRFLQPLDLPPALILARAMRSPLPEAAKTQLLFPYFVRSDPLVEICYCNLVLPRADGFHSRLEISEVMDHLGTLSVSHQELARWSDYMRLRWSRGFLALLRHFGLMERHPGTRLKRLWILPESFAFFWLWLWWQRGSFQQAEDHDLWRLLQVNEGSRDEFLGEGQSRGWWYYQRAGEIVDFHPRFDGIEEWLEYGLA